MSEAMRIAKLERQTALVHDAKDMALALLDNPVVDLILGTVIIEQMLASKTAETWPTQVVAAMQKLVSEAALVTICTAKAIGPALNSPGAAGLVAKFLK